MTAAKPRLISDIYRRGPSTPDSDPFAAWGRVDRLYRGLWRKGIVAVPLAELPEDLRRAVEAWATDQYGART